MEKIKIVKSILDILGDMVIEHEEYEPDTLTMLVKDVNAVVGDKPIDIYIKEGRFSSTFTGRPSFFLIPKSEKSSTKSISVQSPFQSVPNPKPFISLNSRLLQSLSSKGSDI